MRARRWMGWVLLVVSVMWSFAATPAGAGGGQDFRGAMNGIVTGASQGVLPGVTVTVTNTAANVSTDMVPDAEGRYHARYLSLGTCTVIAHLDGLKTAVRAGIGVGVGDDLTVDLASSATSEPAGPPMPPTWARAAPICRCAGISTRSPNGTCRRAGNVTAPRRRFSARA